MILQSDKQATQLLLAGGVGVMPTDTLYGLVAQAANKQAVARLYALKKREHKPGTVVAASVEQLIDLGVDEPILRRVAHLWPAPLSMVIPAADRLRYLDQGVGSLAVRVPSNEELLALLAKTGPLVTSSANLPGGVSAATIKQAHEIFGDGVDFYVDGGDLSDRQPSTVARVKPDYLEVLRQGAVIIPPELRTPA